MFNHPLRQEYWGNPSHRAISECDGGLWHTGVHSIGQWPRILLHDQPTMFQRKDMRTLFIRGTKLISVQGLVVQKSRYRLSKIECKG